jgi:hypothetical protein
MSIETVKKAKTPAKPKTAAKTRVGETVGVMEAAPAATKKAVKASPKPRITNIAAASEPSYAEIAQLAERYWAERGWQDGYAEQDWLRAEQELAWATS